MNVLSLFDGISCGQQSLSEIGVTVNKYFASEINKDSINVTQSNFPNTIQIGDITSLLKIDEEGKVRNDTVSNILKNLPTIDLLIGGSPCQGLSRANNDKLNLKDERSKLFFNFVAIRNWIQKHNNPNVIWLLENVKANNETISIMSEALGYTPYEINSNHFVAQDRVRLYWTNIQLDLSKLPNNDYKIQDIMDSDHGERIKNLVDEGYAHTVRWGKNYIQWDTSGKGSYSQNNRARYPDKLMNTLTKSNGGDKTRIFLGKDEHGIYYRNASVGELELLQGLPKGYTSTIKAKGKRRGLIGDGWTIPVIKWILEHKYN